MKTTLQIEDFIRDIIVIWYTLLCRPVKSRKFYGRHLITKRLEKSTQLGGFRFSSTKAILPICIFRQKKHHWTKSQLSSYVAHQSSVFGMHSISLQFSRGHIRLWRSPKKFPLKDRDTVFEWFVFSKISTGLCLQEGLLILKLLLSSR